MADQGRRLRHPHRVAGRVTSVRRGPRPQMPEPRTPRWFWAWAAFCGVLGLAFLAFVVWAVIRFLDILAAK